MSRTYVLRDEGIRERFKRFLDELPRDQLFEVEVRVFRERASRGQKAKWHAMLGEIARETGNELETIKDFLKDRYGPKIEATIGADQRLVPKSTTRYSLEEMSEMIERTNSWAAHELGLFLA